MSDVEPAPPDGLGTHGRAHWRDITARWELTLPELELLRDRCRLLDEIDALSGRLDADGLIVEGSAGQPVAHPAIATRHAAMKLAAQLLAQLRLPEEDGQAVPSPSQLQASRAAQARWGKRPPRPPRGSRGSAA